MAAVREHEICFIDLKIRQEYLFLIAEIQGWKDLTALYNHLTGLPPKHYSKTGIRTKVPNYFEDVHMSMSLLEEFLLKYEVKSFSLEYKMIDVDYKWQIQGYSPIQDTTFSLTSDKLVDCVLSFYVALVKGFIHEEIILSDTQTL